MYHREIEAICKTVASNVRKRLESQEIVELMINKIGYVMGIVLVERYICCITALSRVL